MIGLVGLATVSACVPAKKFDDLKTDYEKAKQENNRLSNALDDCQDNQNDKTTANAKLTAKKEQLRADKVDLQQERDLLQKKYDNLKDSYDALEENSSSTLTENSKQNRELLAKIEKKQEKLEREKTRLDKLKKDLEARGKRIDELEAVIAAKEDKMKALKNNLSAALTDFEGKGLSVHRKNGKVYVSMENKLLFSSGSWAVNAKGRQAVKQLAQVLADNPDINVLIEGHTDNVPYNGRGELKDNWDLSTKRATAIVHILMQNENINPKSLTAAGRSKYQPVASNTSSSGKAKNRRIEVVLTPEMDKVSQLLEDE